MNRPTHISRVGSETGIFTGRPEYTHGLILARPGLARVTQIFLITYFYLSNPEHECVRRSCGFHRLGFLGESLILVSVSVNLNSLTHLLSELEYRSGICSANDSPTSDIRVHKPLMIQRLKQTRYICSWSRSVEERQICAVFWSIIKFWNLKNEEPLTVSP